MSSSRATTASRDVPTPVHTGVAAAAPSAPDAPHPTRLRLPLASDGFYTDGEARPVEGPGGQLAERWQWWAAPVMALGGGPLMCHHGTKPRGRDSRYCHEPAMFIRANYQPVAGGVETVWDAWRCERHFALICTMTGRVG